MNLWEVLCFFSFFFFFFFSSCSLFLLADVDCVGSFFSLIANDGLLDRLIDERDKNEMYGEGRELWIIDTSCLKTRYDEVNELAVREITHPKQGEF